MVNMLYLKHTSNWVCLLFVSLKDMKWTIAVTLEMMELAILFTFTVSNLSDMEVELQLKHNLLKQLTGLPNKNSK